MICIVNNIVAMPTCWWTLTVITNAPETRAKLLDMFASGYGPAEALAVLRYTVYETIEPSEYSTAFADQAILASIYYVDKYDI